MGSIISENRSKRGRKEMVMTEPVKENREECVVVEKRSVVGTEDEDESQGNGSGGSNPFYRENYHSHCWLWERAEKSN